HRRRGTLLVPNHPAGGVSESQHPRACAFSRLGPWSAATVRRRFALWRRSARHAGAAGRIIPTRKIRHRLHTRARGGWSAAMYIQHPGAGAIEFPLIRLDPADSELDLVQAARWGNREAFRELYARYSPMVNAIALAHARPADAADLVQEVFTRALSKLSALRDAGAFGGWLAM